MIQPDDLRRILVSYQNSLALAQELALKLLDAAQPEGEPAGAEAAARHRRFAGDAIARIEASEDFVGSLWATHGVDRRQARNSFSEDGTLEDRRKRRSKQLEGTHWASGVRVTLRK
jgi:hypothetical protein